MPRTLYERNYEKLVAVLGRPPGDLVAGRTYRLRAPGFMDLVVEVLPGAGARVLSLCHYVEQNGDLCQDPEMTVRVVLPGEDRPGTVEALTFQQAIPPIYRVVYPAPGKVDVALKADLNDFLATWLANLLAQGHRLVER